MLSLFYNLNLSSNYNNKSRVFVRFFNKHGLKPEMINSNSILGKFLKPLKPILR